MLDDATLWDLVTGEHVAIEDFTAAVDAYLAAPTTRDHPVGQSYFLDLAAAVAAHAAAPDATAYVDANEPSRRSVVRSALLMAKPKVRRGCANTDPGSTYLSASGIDEVKYF